MDFRHFSFDAASIRASEYKVDHAAMNISPTSANGPPLPAPLPTPPPPCSVGDLAHILGQQGLRIALVPSQKLASEPLTPLSDHVTFAALPLQRPQLTLSTSQLHFATLRMQRQANVHMQSSSSHISNISTLVEMMVAAKD